jgi:putative inorganic carbon (HCO3(-)) transporter
MTAIPALSYSSGKKISLLAVTLIIATFFSYAASHNVLLTAIVFGGILFFAITLFWTWAITPIVIFFLYSNAVVVAVQFHHVPDIIASIFPGLFLIPLAKIILVDREKILINRTLILMLVFASVQAVGTIFASQPNLAMDKVSSFLLEGIVLYFFILNVVRTPRMLKLTVYALVAAGLLMGAISFCQEITHTYDNNYWGFAQWGASFGTGQSNLLGDVVAPRLEGPIGDDNRYAQIMLTIAPLAFFLAMGVQKIWPRVLFLAATFFIVVGAFLTYSRGGIIALVVVIVLMAFFRFIKLRYLAFLGLILLLVPFAVPNFATRLTSLQNITLSGLLNNTSEGGIASADSSVQSRATEMISSLLMFADYPLIGVGPGNYAVHYQEYAPKAGFAVKLANRQPHTLYGGIAAEDGIFGITCFLLILFVSLQETFKARREWLPRNLLLASIATGLFLGIIIYMITGIFLHLSFIRFLFLVLGLAGSVGAIHQNHEDLDKEVAL